MTQISLTTLQATGIGFFGHYCSTAALATIINCVGIGFRQLVTNDFTGAPTLTDMRASFGIASGGELTIFNAAPPNGSSVWVQVVGEVWGAAFEQEIAADLPANTRLLSPKCS